jgi:hypothetical protein
VDEIEVHIELTSGPVQPRRSTPRSANPRILIGIVAVAVIGLVVWLGSTTPNQAAPIETTTTTKPFPSSTSTTQVAAPAQENPQSVVLKSMPWNEWAADLNANPGAEMAALEGTVLLTSATEDVNLQIIRISSEGVQVDEPECAGEPTGQLVGKLGEYLVVEAAGATCLSPKSNLANGAIIEGIARGSFLMPVNDTSGWFCAWQGNSAQLTRYSIESGLGAVYEIPSCPTAVRDESILMEAPMGDEFPDARTSFYWTELGESAQSEPIVDDCDITGFGTDLLLCRTDSIVEVVSLVTGETVTTFALELVPDGVFGYGPTSPDGRYIAFSFFDMQGAQSGRPEPQSGVVIDLESGTITDPNWPGGNFVQLSWISETQLAVLNQPASDCDECTWGLTVVNVTDFSWLFQLHLPETSTESGLQLQQ